MRVERISSVNNFQNRYRSFNRKNSEINVTTLPMYSYGRDLLNKPNNLTFTAGISKNALNYALQIPVEDRLASIIQGIKQGDLVLLGKDYTQIMKNIRSLKNKLTTPIKRLFYLPDNKLNKNYVFYKTPLGDFNLFNVNSEELIVRAGSAHYSVESGISMNILPGNLIQYIGEVGKTDRFTFKDAPKTNLSEFKKAFCIPHDYTSEVERKIQKINNDILSKEITEVNKGNDIIDFSKIGGQAQAVQDLKRGILYPVKYPSAYSQGDITRGYILYGPPGTGKTEISRALANEAGINYMYMSGTEFENKYVGESEANVRAFFESLKENQPAIGVIDEIDAIGKERGDKDVYGAKVVNQILTSMTDLYNSGDNVFILGLTNKYETLDSALKRSERFSKHIKIGAPDRQGTEEILKIHSKNLPLEDDFNHSKVSDKLYEIKAVGSDIKYISKLARENMMNRLGIYEKMENGTFQDSDMIDAKVTIDDFLQAITEFSQRNKKDIHTKIGFSK